MNIISRCFRQIRRFFAMCRDWILHTTIFHRKITGEVEFYGMDEPVQMDGFLVVTDLRFKCPAVYGYRFGNRYMLFTTPQQRCAAVWQAIMLHDAVRPLATIEDNRAFTPYGNYDEVPASYARLLRTAAEPHAV